MIDRLNRDGFFNINLNSVLLICQLAAVAGGILIFIKNTESGVNINTQRIEEMKKQLDENRSDVRQMRAQDAAIAVLKNDVEAIKASMGRIEVKIDSKPVR